MPIDEIIHEGEAREYVFADDATDWEKEAIREFQPDSFSEIQDALEWREAMDELENDHPKIARVMRGKHPTKDKDIGRAKPQKGRGNGQS